MRLLGGGFGEICGLLTSHGKQGKGMMKWDTNKIIHFFQAKTVIEEANDINKIIPGTDNYYYKKYFLPKYLGIINCSIK